MPIYKTRCLKCQMVVEDYYNYVDGFNDHLALQAS